MEKQLLTVTLDSGSRVLRSHLFMSVTCIIWVVGVNFYAPELRYHVCDSYDVLGARDSQDGKGNGP